MVWAYFAAFEPGQISIINCTRNPESHQRILKENVVTSVRELNRKREWIMQQDNETKRTRMVKDEIILHAFHGKKPSDIPELLKLICTEDRAKIPPS